MLMVLLLRVFFLKKFQCMLWYFLDHSLRKIDIPKQCIFVWYQNILITQWKKWNKFWSSLDTYTYSGQIRDAVNLQHPLSLLEWLGLRRAVIQYYMKGHWFNIPNLGNVIFICLKDFCGYPYHKVGFSFIPIGDDQAEPKSRVKCILMLETSLSPAHLEVR